MKSVATSVRITAASNSLLSVLSGRTGKPKAQIVEEALRDWEDRMFWTEVERAFVLPESPELRKERELWDRTAADGFEAIEKSKPAGRRRREK